MVCLWKGERFLTLEPCVHFFYWQNVWWSETYFLRWMGWWCYLRWKWDTDQNEHGQQLWSQTVLFGSVAYGPLTLDSQGHYMAVCSTPISSTLSRSFLQLQWAPGLICVNCLDGQMELMSCVHSFCLDVASIGQLGLHGLSAWQLLTVNGPYVAMESCRLWNAQGLGPNSLGREVFHKDVWGPWWAYCPQGPFSQTPGQKASG